MWHIVFLRKNYLWHIVLQIRSSTKSEVPMFKEKKKKKKKKGRTKYHPSKFIYKTVHEVCGEIAVSLLESHLYLRLKCWTYWNCKACLWGNGNVFDFIQRQNPIFWAKTKRAIRWIMGTYIFNEDFYMLQFAYFFFYSGCHISDIKYLLSSRSLMIIVEDAIL